MQTTYLELEHSINIIQARIIDLTSKRDKLQADLEHHVTRLDLGIERKNIEQTKAIIRRLKSRLYEVEKMLFLNQSLLSFDDRHEYQLEN